MSISAQVRALRRREGLTQAGLAHTLGVSASYLNLIEHDRRALPAQLLIRLAQQYKLDLASFSGDAVTSAHDLMEVFGDAVFEGHPIGAAEVREMASAHPAVARAVVDLYRRYKDVLQRTDNLAEHLEGGRTMDGLDPAMLPAEDVSDFIQRHANWFPELEEEAEKLWKDAGLTVEGLPAGLTRHLASKHHVRVETLRGGAGAHAVRRYDPARGVLQLSELLPPRSRNFQLAYQLAFLRAEAVVDRLADDRDLTTDASRALGRIALANYFAGAVLMPYRPFLEAARQVRYDVELLGHRFRTSFEQVCHRLTTLRRPKQEGIPFHLIRVDVAGNISKKYSASGIRFARFSGACPRWNVHAAFLTPGQIRVQLSKNTDDVLYFCFSRTLDKHVGGWTAPYAVHAIGLGCRLEHADQTVYADGLQLAERFAVEIGTTCRLCSRTDCDQRAFPPLHQSMHIDENVRGVSLYAPPGGEPG